MLAHSNARNARAGLFRGHPGKRKIVNTTRIAMEAGRERHTTFSSHEKSWRGKVQMLLFGRNKLQEIVDDSIRLAMIEMEWLL